MKEIFKKRWLELLLLTIAGVYFTACAFKSEISINKRLLEAFMGGACLAPIIDFLSQLLTRTVLKIFSKESSEL